jgi:hypothetical protein
MAAKKRVEEPVEEPSRAAGGCVLVALGGGAFAGVFAASPEAGVLAVWVVGAVALWRAARRRVSDSSATPPPRGVPPSGDVFAGETGQIARVVHSPEGVMCTLHPVREETTQT